MEQYVIASVGKQLSRKYLQRGQVEFGHGFLVAILHGSEDDNDGLLACREAHLMRYVVDSINKPQSVKDALNEAFDQMDEKLIQENKDAAEAGSGLFSHEMLWRSRDNSCVAVVRDRMVHCMGFAGGRLVLCRSGRDHSLLVNQLHNVLRIFVTTEPPDSEDYRFRFYREETLEGGDEFLFLATDRVWDYVDEDSGGLSPVFFTRVKSVGLVEAAKQIIGDTLDFPKVLIAVPLVTVVSDWPVCHVEVPYDDDGPEALIVPLVDGKPQEPKAKTSLVRDYGSYPPIVVTGPRTVLEDWLVSLFELPLRAKRVLLQGTCAKYRVTLQFEDGSFPISDERSQHIFVVAVAQDSYTGEAAQQCLDDVISSVGVPCELVFLFTHLHALYTWADRLLGSRYKPDFVKDRDDKVKL